MSQQGDMSSGPLRSLMTRYESGEVFGAAALAKETAGILGHIATDAKRHGREAILFELRRAADSLLNRFGGMAPVVNALHAVFSHAEKSMADEQTPAELVDNIETSVFEFQTKIDRAIEQVAIITSRSIRCGDTIFVFTAGSTVLRGLSFARHEGKDFGVILTGSEPRYVARVTSALAKLGIPTTCSSDLAMAVLMQKSSVILVGADAIAIDGSILSRVGTHALGLVAHERQVPFRVAADSSKLDPRTASGAPLLASCRPSRMPEGNQFPPGTTVEDYGYEVTPPSLVTSIISEFGILPPPACHLLLANLPISRFVASKTRGTMGEAYGRSGKNTEDGHMS